MKRLSLTILFLALAATHSMAADPRPIAERGAKALLFDFSGLANLGAGSYGGGFGGKYYLATDLAFRLSFGFNTSSRTDHNFQSPLPVGRIGESSLTSTTFVVAPGITYNVAKSSTVAAYLGGMVTFTSTRDKRDGNSGGLGADFDNGESFRQSTTGWGFAGILGVEWFPWENISFAGEYRLGYNHASSETESTTTAASVTADGPTTSGFGLGSANTAELTLAVFF